VVTKFSKYICIVSAVIGLFFCTQDEAFAETAFERVVKTGIIHCGYSVWYPELTKDPNTGKLSGYDYDVMNAVAQVLGLKIEWTEEVGWGAAEQGLAAGRYDISCNGFWGPPARTRGAFYSIPFVSHPLFIVTKTDLVGSDDDYRWLNDQGYKATVLRGTVHDVLTSTIFPKSQTIDAFELSSDGNVLLDVSSGKVDFTISNLTPVQRFLSQNPGQLKVIDKPVFFAKGAFLLPNDDYRLKHMVDSALEFLIESGAVDKIMERYMGDDKTQWLSVRSENQRNK
jgi:ABC-type amino acid transport substrate-binding protein